ncbi:MAG: histidine kinase [Ferruginibacter sp.]|nr:histidine kinase [Ferruginibacter sp.]
MKIAIVIKISVFLVLNSVLQASTIKGQSISFKHLNTANGLSDINVSCMTVDKNGFLWIGTSYGLNVYDGYEIATFKEQEKQLATNFAVSLMCDKDNVVWIGTAEGVTRVDADRRFHRVILGDTITRFSCLGIEETKTFGKIIYSNLGQFYYDNTAKKWVRLDWIPEKLRFAKIQDIAPFAEDKIIFTMDSIVAILDYANRRIVYEETFYPLLASCKVSDHDIGIGLQTGQVKVININTKARIREYWLTSDFNGQTINTNLTDLQCAANGDLLVTTGFAGLIIIDKAGKITRHEHDPLNPNSISTNNTSRVLAEKNGDVFVATNSMGLDICNIRNKQASYTPVFTNASGELYDNYLNDIIEDKDGSIWLGSHDRIIQWDRKKNRSKYFYYYMKTPLQGLRTVAIRALCFDNNNRLWLSALGGGVAVLNKAAGTLYKIPHDTTKAPALISHYVHDLLPASDGNIWGCTNTGIFNMDPRTLTVNKMDNHPLLKPILNKRSIALYEDSHQNIWIGVVGNGVYKYNKKGNSLVKFSVDDGLLSNTCYGFTEDRNGNMYLLSQFGFNMINREGKIRSYTKQNGLRYDRCFSILEDDAGFMWIANNKCLIKFNPVNNSMEYFDDNAGLSVYGFKAESRCKLRSGELLFGSQRGVNNFFPAELTNSPAKLNVSIYKALLLDSAQTFSSNSSFQLPYTKNTVHFFFTAINLLGSDEIQYQYMLEGFDKEWQPGIDIREVRYASLPPGKYTFKVKASKNGIDWTDSGNKVDIKVIAPIWQQAWFIVAAFILLSSVIYVIARYRNKRSKEQQEEVETQKVINYFASSIYQQQTVSNILWDVARNCIGRLHFEDCVIYLIDEEKKLLVQKAAHGPKNPLSYEIQDPMNIPLGKGITGSVALSGQAEIIPDTSKDPRYIIDDKQRFSEITVPIISDGKVLGVIDCEHYSKNFFTQKHLNILTTIASLCANKIVRAKAEEEKMAAEKIVIDTKEKMADVEMQALRAQMNPHFIFNCLNSINRYIVKSDQVTASLYLTRFAKLIRLILDNSNTKNVILTNELEALRLYIEMEALRFEKKFTYHINIDKSTNTDSLEVPPLIIQPYVENAIWHGLLHKETGGHLSIDVRLKNDSILECTIEDNGVGRDKASELKSKSATTRKSLGMQLTENRISLLNKHAQLNATVEIIDLKTNDHAAGTKVILKIPV